MHSSPLMATVVVLSGLGLLAIPLDHLTSASVENVTPNSAASAMTDATIIDTNAVVRMRLLRPAKSMVVRDSAERELWKAENLSTGETEADTRIRLDNGHLDLSVSLEMETAAEETAVFFTVMPDGREERHGHLIGNGTLKDHLSFDWTEN